MIYQGSKAKLRKYIVPILTYITGLHRHTRRNRIRRAVRWRSKYNRSYTMRDTRGIRQQSRTDCTPALYAG